MLAFQKSRVASQHAIKKANSLLKALSGNVFLLSEQQFRDHCRAHLPAKLTNIPFNEGIVIKDLMPIVLLNSQHICKPLSVYIPEGEFYILQAPSGYGKSLIILSLLHLINHTGEVFFVSKGNAINMHNLSKTTCLQGFAFFRKEDLPSSGRLVDIYSKVLQNYLKDFYQSCEAQFGSLLNELAWNSEDNLLEHEVNALNSNEPSVFPNTMTSTLIQIRYERCKILSSWLKEAFEDDIHANRVFCSLSAGEQRRAINLLTLKTALINLDVKLTILDEPLANLDNENIERQLQMLKTFQTEKATPLLIITHHHVQDIERCLKKPDTAFNQMENLFLASR